MRKEGGREREREKVRGGGDTEGEIDERLESKQ